MNKKQKSLNNKGFSLVELIIVMAIMVVLVGALAPQYVKYLDKSKVSTDTQWVDGLRQAIEITYIDPSIDNPDLCKNATNPAEIPEVADLSTDKEKAFWNEVFDVMGYKGHDAIVAGLKLDDTTNTGDAAKDVSIKYWIDDANGNVTVTVTGGKYSGTSAITVD